VWKQRFGRGEDGVEKILKRKMPLILGEGMLLCLIKVFVNKKRVPEQLTCNKG
jgi:hypothetical protein